MAYVFFRASEDALDNLTEVFNLIHPLRASLAFTRNVVNTLYTDVRDVDVKVCQRVVDKDKLFESVNYKCAFFDTSYENQEEKLAWILLNNLFAIHEGWADRLFNEIFFTGPTGWFLDNKEFCQTLERTGLTAKFQTYFTPSGRESTVLSNSFFPKYQSKSKCDFGKLDNLMVCYRYFKEARNCYMHKNFLATGILVNAYNDFLGVATTADLDVDEVPETIPPVCGETVQLKLRGVIGFSDILRKIIIISDAYLIKNKLAENEIWNRRPTSFRKEELGKSKEKVNNKIKSYCKKAKLIPPYYSDDVKQLFIDLGIFSI